MRTLKIKTYPENILRGSCELVIKITETEKVLLEDMVLTMKRASGIGLAAPQVGINRRLIVADIGDGPLKLANPEILSSKGKGRMEEGCISVPGALVCVERPAEVVVRGINEFGEQVEVEARGLLARVLQHEIDHLNGKLIIDYMNVLQKLKFKLRSNAHSR